MLRSLGTVEVEVPGTPIRATSNESDPSAVFPCYSILVIARLGNIGDVYIGGANMVRSTFVDCYGLLPVPTVNVRPTFSAGHSDAPNPLNAADFWIDVDEPCDGVHISVLRR